MLTVPGSAHAHAAMQRQRGTFSESPTLWLDMICFIVWHSTMQCIQCLDQKFALESTFYYVYLMGEGEP